MASDALRQYKAKRNFAVTSESTDGGRASAGALSFVIQKHWASRLHYDFRLELDGGGLILTRHSSTARTHN